MNNVNIFDIQDIKNLMKSIGYIWDGEIVDMHDGRTRAIEDKDLCQLGFKLPIMPVEDKKSKKNAQKKNCDFYINNFTFKELEYVCEKDKTTCYENGNYTRFWQEQLLNRYGNEYRAKLAENNAEIISYLNSQNAQKSLEVASLGQKWRALQDEIKENEDTISNLTKQNEQLQKEIENSIEQ